MSPDDVREFRMAKSVRAKEMEASDKLKEKEDIKNKKKIEWKDPR